MRAIVLSMLVAIAGCTGFPPVPVAPCGTTVLSRVEGTPPNATTTTYYYSNYCQPIYYPAYGYYYYEFRSKGHRTR